MDVVSSAANASLSTVEILANVAAGVDDIPCGSSAPHSSQEDGFPFDNASLAAESDTADSTAQ